MARFCECPGEAVPGDLERGGTYLCEDWLDANAEGVEEVGFEGAEIVCTESDTVLVVIVLEVEVTFVAVVETWGLETRAVGDIEETGFDFA
jgi:hypothetical protein